MAKKPELVIVNDDDGGVILAPAKANKPATLEDTLNPIDADTGQKTFDDLDSRFNMPDPKVEGDEDDSEEGEEEETAEELEDLFPKNKKPGKKKTKDGEGEEEDDDLDEDGLDENDEQPNDKDEGEEEESEEEEEEEEPAPARGFRGRLQREQRLRREAEDNFADLKVRLDTIEASVNQRASEDAFATKQKDLDSKIEAKRAELLAAEEAGNSADKIRLIEELSDLKAEKRAEVSQHEAAKAVREQRKTTASPIVKRKVEAWKRQHPKFDRDPVFAAFALGVDRQLMSEGYDPESSDYYKELDRRCAKRYPEEYKGRTLDREEKPGKPKAKHPSAGFRRESDGSRRPMKKRGEFEVGKGGQVKLTKQHVKTMRTFGLDPDSAEDVREFVRNNQ